MKRILLLVLCAVLLMGCATTANYKAVLDSWVGADINRYISVNGYPDKVFPLPDGNKVYQWSESDSYYVSGIVTSGSYSGRTRTDAFGNSWTTGTYTPPKEYGGGMHTDWCVASLETDSTGRIIKWHGEGNNCEALKTDGSGKLKIE